MSMAVTNLRMKSGKQRHPIGIGTRGYGGHEEGSIWGEHITDEEYNT